MSVEFLDLRGWGHLIRAFERRGTGGATRLTHPEGGSILEPVSGEMVLLRTAL